MRVRIKDDDQEKYEEDKTVAIWDNKLLIASLHQLRHIEIADEFSQIANKFSKTKTLRRRAADEKIPEVEKTRQDFYVINMRPNWRIHAIQDAYNSGSETSNECTLLCEDEDDCQLVFFKIKELNKEKSKFIQLTQTITDERRTGVSRKDFITDFRSLVIEFKDTGESR